MNRYKPHQGRMVRVAAFWISAGLLVFGCSFLFDLLVSSEPMRTPLGGMSVLSIDMSPAFLLCASIGLIGTIAIFIWQQKPKVADLLIDTEGELRKVTWPTMDEVIDMSTVVIFFVLFLGSYLALSDVVLAKIMTYLLWGGAA